MKWNSCSHFWILATKLNCHHSNCNKMTLFAKVLIEKQQMLLHFFTNESRRSFCLVFFLSLQIKSLLMIVVLLSGLLASSLSKLFFQRRMLFGSTPYLREVIFHFSRQRTFFCDYFYFSFEVRCVFEMIAAFYFSDKEFVNLWTCEFVGISVGRVWLPVTRNPHLIFKIQTCPMVQRSLFYYSNNMS